MPRWGEGGHLYCPQASFYQQVLLYHSFGMGVQSSDSKSQGHSSPPFWSCPQSTVLQHKMWRCPSGEPSGPPFPLIIFLYQCNQNMQIMMCGNPQLVTDCKYLQREINNKQTNKQPVLLLSVDNYWKKSIMSIFLALFMLSNLGHWNNFYRAGAESQ